MADPVSGTAASQGTSATTAANSACQLSKAAVDEMMKGDVSDADKTGASKQMDPAKLKDVIEKMNACQKENQDRLSKLLNDVNARASSKIHAIRQ